MDDVNPFSNELPELFSTCTLSTFGYRYWENSPACKLDVTVSFYPVLTASRGYRERQSLLKQLIVGMRPPA
jgi:hypothetical protein